MSSCKKCLKKEVELMVLQKCCHEVCFKCLCTYLKKFTSAKILCPIEGCTRFIADFVIRKCLSNDQIEFYDVLCCVSNTIKCLITDCPYFISYESKEGNFICPICEQPNCITCEKIHDVDIHCLSITNYNQKEMDIKASDLLSKKKRALFIEYMKEYKLIPNPEGFECSVCDSFILPRNGAILRNCLHCFCISCLKQSLAGASFIKDLSCIIKGCGKNLDPKEISELRSDDQYSTMVVKEASSQFFQCKNENCSGIWDTIMDKGIIKCNVCGEANCIECKDIHNGMTCTQFRLSSRFIQSKYIEKILDKEENIKCYLCKHILIRKGGCGAIYCSGCGNHTCIYTGKIAGKHDSQKCCCKETVKCPKIKLYCGCSSTQTCDIRCLYGCIPEDHNN